MDASLLTPEAKAEKLHYYLSRGSGCSPWQALYLAIEDVLIAEATPMSSFTDPLELRQLADGEHWQTLRHLEYHAGAKESAEVYCVPEGFVTDGASIPRALWAVVGHPLEQYAAAAVLHDWLYRTAPVEKSRADALFLEAMGVLGVAWLRRKVMYWAVSWFGGSAWDACRKAGRIVAR